MFNGALAMGEPTALLSGAMSAVGANNQNKHTDFNVKHDQPLSSGYGVHETERMSIRSPEFALRESLRQSVAVNLKMHNDAKGITHNYEPTL